LGQILSHLGFLDEAIEQMSKEVENRIAPFFEADRSSENDPGVDQKTAELIVAEIGIDMSRFPDPPSSGLLGWTLPWEQ